MNSAQWSRSAAVLVAIAIMGWAGAIPEQSAHSQESPATDDKSAASQVPAAGAAGKTDRFGDPLPAGALARMGTVRWRHSGSISFVGYTGQGKQLLTGCSDGFYRIWDVSSGKEIRRFSMGAAGNVPRGGIANAGGAVYFVGNAGRIALSSDGATLAAMGADGGVRLWDVAAGKEIRTIAMTPAANMPRRMMYGGANLAFAPDGKSLATQSSDQVIHLWDIASGKEIRRIGRQPENKKPLNAVAFFVAGAGGGNPLVFSPDGKTLGAVGSEPDAMNMLATTIRLYDVAGGKELRRIKPTQQNNFISGGLVFAPDSKSIGWSGNGSIDFFEVNSGKKLWEHKLGQPGIIAQEMVFAPGGKILAVRASNRPGIQLWDPATGKELRRIGGQEANVAAFGAFVRVRGFGGAGGPQLVAFSPDGKVLAEGTSGGAVRLWDVAGGKEILYAGGGHHTGVSTLAVAPDGKTLTTYAGGRTLCQWEVSSGNELRRVQLPPAANIALSADGRTAACSNGAGRIEMWDIAAGKSICTIESPQPQQRIFGGAGGIALSPDGKVVALQGFDQMTRVYDAATGKDLALLSDSPDNAAAPGGIAFTRAVYFGGGVPVLSRDGTALAVAGGIPGMAANPYSAPTGGNSIRMWNIARGKKPRRFESQQSGITAMTFSPDGRIIASGNTDGSITLWEALTGKECLRIKGKGSPPPAAPAALTPRPGVVFAPGFGGPGMTTATIAISADGRTLAAGSSDRSVRLWDLRTGQELGAYTGHQSSVLSVAFAPDNQTVISGSNDTTALVWDGARAIKQRRPAATELKAEDVNRFWQDLAADPVKAFPAVTALSAAPRQALDLLKQQLKPAPGVDPVHLAQLAADLDSKDFKIRQHATAALEKLGELAEPALRKVLEKDCSLETRRRVERLLELIVNDQTPPAEVQRTLRGVWVLEQLHTPEARQLLQSLAAGAPGDRLTRDAQAALRRLGG
jgi:WD40 repeat protein